MLCLSIIFHILLNLKYWGNFNSDPKLSYYYNTNYQLNRIEKNEYLLSLNDMKGVSYDKFKILVETKINKHS